MNGRRIAVILVCLVCLGCLVCCTGVACAASDPQRTLADRSLEWPTWSALRRIVLLQDYNTRVVVLGATLLGCAGGLVGSFTLLRKRALMGDAISHATLPGIGLAFVIVTAAGGDGKSLPVLLVGATATGLLGVLVIVALGHLTRLKEDTALGAVLSVFFGAGVALLGVIQQMPAGHAAGLEAFIYGKTASMGAQDAQLIAVAALLCIGICLALFKELKLLCFDAGFAGSRGFPVLRLDLLLMTLVVIVTIVGLQAVGLILMLALLVIPAAAARFWTDKMPRMAWLSAVCGAVSALVGAAVSALFSKLPSGAMIVLVCTAFFLMSMVCGTQRGLLVRFFRRERLNRSVDRQHLLRAMYELLEPLPAAESGTAQHRVAIDALLHKRSWSKSRLERAIRRATRAGLTGRAGELVSLTETGVGEARRLARQHRLWKLYLTTYAEVAPSQVDRDADAIEHVLEPAVVSELETLLKAQRFQATPAAAGE